MPIRIRTPRFSHTRLASRLSGSIGALATLSTVACGGGGDGPTAPPTVATITVSAAQNTLSSIGETAAMTAVAKSAKGAVISSAAITWSSSNDAVASVAGGVVTANGNGSVTITASSGGVSGSASMTVQQVVAQAQLTAIADTIRALGDTVRLTAVAKDARGNAIAGKTAVWTSQTPNVATVDAAGIVTAIAEGAATISAAIDAQSAQRVVQVRQRGAKLVITRQPSGARAGVALTTQPVVQVQDARGNLLASDNSTVVTATIASGGGSVTAGSTATASAGVATFSTLALGGTIGARTIQLTGTSVGNVTSESFTLTAGNASQLVVASGSGQSVLANSVAAQPLVAAVRDAFGNGVSGVPVAFAVTAGGGTLATTLGASDASGNASTTYTPGRNAGSGGVRATSSALASAQADFAVTVLPNGIVRGTVTVLPFNASAGVGAVRAARANGAPSNSATSTGVTAVSAVASTDYVPGELLVTYKSDAVEAPAVSAGTATVRAAAPRVGRSMRLALEPLVARRMVRVTGVSPVVRTARVRLEDGVTEAEAISALRADPRVQAVERNGVVHTDRVPDTPIDAYLRGVYDDRDGQLRALNPLWRESHTQIFPQPGAYPDNAQFPHQSWHYNMAGLPQAWQTTTGSASIIVAVIDDGIRFDHPAMNGQLTNDGYDFVPVGTVAACAGGTVSTNGDGDGPDADPTKPNSVSFNSGNTCVLGTDASGNHGLHVAGTIGATRNNSLGIVGVNWAVKIRPIRVLGVHGSGSNFDVTQGILYAAGLPADNGAGGTVTLNGPPTRVINMSLGGSSFNTAMQNAVLAAEAAGIVVVASAGNNNTSTAQYPASYPDVISVSALGPSLNKASYSSFGPTVVVAAPGGQTSAGFTSGVLSSTWNYQTGQPRTDSWQGTSMAAPHVTGIAALVLAAQPSLTYAQLRSRIVDFSVDLGSTGRDNTYGFGLVNARNAMSASFGPARRVFVRLIDATTGAVVRTVQTAANGSYEIGGLADGQYWVFAGEDEGGDGVIGLPSRAFGRFAVTTVPAVIAVAGADVYPATFEIRNTFEVEPNGATDTANELLVDGYVNGDITSVVDQDFYRIRVTQSGTYIIQVTGQSAACKVANEADPNLALLSAAGASLGQSDDLDSANGDYCARLSLSLQPGTYYARVGGTAVGRYVVSVRKQ